MKSFGWIYLLPSEAINVIVRYYPKWLISCVLPETTRDIFARRVDYRTDEVHEGSLKIKTPSLLLSHSIKKPWVPKSKTEEYFSIHRIDLDKSEGIYANPYRLANVYSSGKICYGFELPSNLRRANNLFWSSPFNEDNCPYVDKHLNECTNKDHEYKNYNHKPNKLSECACECCINTCGCQCLCDLNTGFFDWLKGYYNIVISEKPILKSRYFCGDKYFACPKSTKAIFISNNASLLKKIPQKNWRKDGQQATVVIGTAQVVDNEHWKVDLGSTVFTIPKTQVTIV